MIRFSVLAFRTARSVPGVRDWERIMVRGWVAYTRIEVGRQTEIRTFADIDQAQSFIDDTGWHTTTVIWQSPVPSLPRSPGQPFSGPWLREVLKCRETEDPTTLSFEDV